MFAANLFSPLSFREVSFRNRIFVSPMCQYSSIEGVATPWHFVHLGSRAVGGAGLVIVEASAVSPVGRITPGDMGIWNSLQIEALKPITAFIKENGAVAGIQIAHAGRKASTSEPWRGGGGIGPLDGGWTPLAPSSIRFTNNYPLPDAMSAAQIEQVDDEFAHATKNAFSAGFEVIEIHMAHGYLLHSFLSPLSNRREDGYGGSLENRMRFPLRIAATVRKNWPAHLPVFVRISATDWTDGGWDLSSSIVLAEALKQIGIDLIDCSTGGNVPHASIPVEPGYQVPFAQAIRKTVGIATGAVGMITEPSQANQILLSGKADVVLLARELLRDPYWPMRAALELGFEAKWPKQYERAQAHRKKN